VTENGTLVYSKFREGKFPEADGIIRALQGLGRA